MTAGLYRVVTRICRGDGTTTVTAGSPISRADAEAWVAQQNAKSFGPADVVHVAMSDADYQRKYGGAA